MAENDKATFTFWAVVIGIILLVIIAFPNATTSQCGLECQEQAENNWHQPRNIR